MTPETKEKLIAQAEFAKKKALATAAWCKEKTVATWKSGRKGKAICVGVAAAVLLAVCFPGCGKKNDAKLDASELLAKQLTETQAEMQRIQAETQAKIAADNAERAAEMERKAAENEARQKEQREAQMKAAREYQEQFQAEMKAAVQKAQEDAQARTDARLAERDQRLAEAEARRKEIAAEREARIKANQEKERARKQAIEDAKNHVPAATGELAASALSDKDFSQIFIGDSQDDEGTIYAHGRSENIRVFQSTSSGLLVGYAQGANPYAAQAEDLMERLGVSFDRVVWVDTKTRLNEENRPLRPGFYVRKGMHSYIGTDGGEHTLAQYVEIADETAVAMLKDELKRRAEEKRIAEEEAAELADERGAYELDIPIKSLCGFKLGAPPSQVKGLLQYEDGTPVRVLSYRSDMFGNKSTYRLAKPFRLFTHAEVRFADNGVGKHLESVELKGTPFDSNKVTKESYEAEVEATARLIEKKFGIVFQRDFAYHASQTTSVSERDYDWRDKNGKEEIRIHLGTSHLLLYFTAAGEVGRMDNAAKEATKTTIQFDEDAGADQL